MIEDTAGGEKQRRGAARGTGRRRGSAARDVMRSVSGSGRAQEALRESEERWRSLVETIPDVIMTVDADGTILFINRTVLGFTVEETIGSKVYDYVPPEHHDTMRKRLEAVFEMGEGHEFEIGGAGPFGRTSWYFSRIGPVVRDGRVVAATLVATDITEKRQADEALRESEEKYRRLVEDSIDGIAITEGAVIRFVNPALLNMLGFQSEEEMIGRPATDFLPPGNRDAMLKRNLAREEGQPVPNRYEFKAVRKDGSTFDAEASIGSVSYQGRAATQAVVRDITKRKRADEALWESEERYRHLVENINEAIYELDANGQVTYISPVVEQVGGYSPSEIVGRPAADFVHPDDLPRVAEGFQKALSGHPTPNEYRLLSKAGEVLWVRSFGRPITAGGRIVGVRGVLTDITQRKQAEEALRDSREALSALLNASNESAWLIKADHTILAVNETGARRLGKSVDDIVGMIPIGLASPDVVERRMAKVDEVVRSGKPCRFQDTREGRWFDNSIHPVFDAEGKVDRLAIFSTDITEQRQAEQALRESEEKYRDLVENINDVVFALDATGRVTYISPAVTDISGYSPSEMIGRPFTDFVNPHDVPSAMERFQRGLSGDHEPIELRFVSKSGEVHWLRSSGRPIFDGDRVVGLRGVQTNITERKRAEEALRESEERFRQVAATAGEWISEVDGEGRYTYSSPAVKEILGYEPEEVIGRHFYDFYAPEDREQLLAGAREISAAKKEYFRAIVRNVHKDGHTIIIESSGLPILDAAGNVAGYRNVARDITERKAAEEALRESEERYRGVVEDTPGLICCYMPGGEITFVNRAYCEYFDKTPDELVGTNFLSLIPEEDRETVMANISALRVDSPTQSHEHQVIAPGGEIRWQHWTNRAIFDALGQVVCFQSIGEDITERKVAEEGLLESERRYRSLIEASPDAIALSDLNANIIMVNEQTAKMLGFDSPEDMIGLSSFEFTAPEDRERAVENTRKTLETGTVRNAEYTALRKDGSRFPVELSASLILDAEGNPVAFTAVTRDITERKRAEEALRESEERLRAFANAVPDIAFILDENGRYVEVLAAPETKDLLYASGDTTRGRRLHDVLPKRSADQFLSVIRKTIDTQEPQILEYVLAVQAGRRWFEGRTAPLSLAGEKQMVVWISHDITERKQAEAGREKAREELDRKAERAARGGNRYGLSFRELTVLDLVSAGKPDKEIAMLLGIRPRTVSKHVENIRAKMGASSRTEAGVRAIREELLK